MTAKKQKDEPAPSIGPLKGASLRFTEEPPLFPAFKQMVEAHLRMVKLMELASKTVMKVTEIEDVNLSVNFEANKDG